MNSNESGSFGRAAGRPGAKIKSWRIRAAHAAAYAVLGVFAMNVPRAKASSVFSVIEVAGSGQIQSGGSTFVSDSRSASGPGWNVEGSVNASLETGTMAMWAYANNQAVRVQLGVQDFIQIKGAPGTVVYGGVQLFFNTTASHLAGVHANTYQSIQFAATYTGLDGVTQHKSGQYVYGWGETEGGIPPEIWTHNSGGDVTVISEAKTGFNVVFHGRFHATVLDNGSTAPINFFLNTTGIGFGYGGGGGILDSTHTGQFSVVLPPGYSFVSGSGVFLTQGPPSSSVVPEPASASTVGAGIGVLALCRRDSIRRWWRRRFRMLAER